MNKTYLLFFPLWLASLACLETAIGTVTISTPTPTQPAPPAASTPPLMDEPYAGAVYEIPTTAATCAQVNTTALHLRAAPDENAQVIDWLINGEVVTVHTRGPWSLVTAGTFTGYARSVYLSEVECQ